MVNSRVKHVIFPVGGLGTRFLPATKAIPKEMLPVYNKPLIHWCFKEAVEAGIEQFIFIIGRNKNAIVNHFDSAFELEANLKQHDKDSLMAEFKLPKAGQIVFIRQQEPRGLGHAIWCARSVVSAPSFGVMLPDELFLCGNGGGGIGAICQLVEYQEKHNAQNVIGTQRVDIENVKKYGIVSGKEHGNGRFVVESMVEKPSSESAPSNISISGRYILEQSVFEAIENTEPDLKGEIQLTNAMQEMISNGSAFDACSIAGKRFDCGVPIGLLEANIEFAIQNANKDEAREIKSMLSRYTDGK